MNIFLETTRAAIIEFGKVFISKITSEHENLDKDVLLQLWIDLYKNQKTTCAGHYRNGTSCKASPKNGLYCLRHSKKEVKRTDDVHIFDELELKNKQLYKKLSKHKWVHLKTSLCISFSNKQYHIYGFYNNGVVEDYNDNIHPIMLL